jgi:hypothetical protein
VNGAVIDLPVGEYIILLASCLLATDMMFARIRGSNHREVIDENVEGLCVQNEVSRGEWLILA